VGKLICWIRESESSSWQKDEAKEQFGSLMWMLKSPVIRISEGEVARSSSRIEKSDKKLHLLEEGGQ